MKKYAAKNPNNSRQSTYNVVRYIREEFQVVAANRNEALSNIINPHTITVTKQTVTKAK